MSYVIKSVKDNAEYIPKGGALELLYNHDPECVIAGPAETGKTLAACWKAHTLAVKYPGCQGAIVRKTQKSIYGSVLQTYEKIIKGAPVDPYGGEKPEKYLYANGSTIWVGGMDNPDKILSSERDFVYINQAEELEIDDWEKLTTRTTGRSSVIPYPQVFGDANPAGSMHWIVKRGQTGVLKLIRSVHQDNPTLYDDNGNLTEQGERTMSRLANLTGVRRKRLFEGLWVTAEGAVYDMFTNKEPIVRERPLTDFVRFGLAQDEGYTNPSVILLVGEDTDGRLHIIEEFYRSGVLQSDVVQKSCEFNEKYHIYTARVDASAAGLIADLINSGLPAEPQKGRVLDGIQSVQNYLKVQEDGLPRLSVDPACVNTINEFESYVWKPGKDEPNKDNDHAMDAIRYYINGNGATWWLA